MTLDLNFAHAIWAAKCLFDSGQVTGSTGNISFRYDDNVYMSATNSCFGRLQKSDFSRLSSNGELLEGRRPSKEVPLHLALYAAHPDVTAVIHTHSYYATLWSMFPHLDVQDVVPTYTPYLTMKLGQIQLVPYAKPGTNALFDLFKRNVGIGNGYLLANHGAVVGGKTILSAFYAIEELEQSCRFAVALNGKGVPEIEV